MARCQHLTLHDFGSNTRNCRSVSFIACCSVVSIGLRPMATGRIWSATSEPRNVCGCQNRSVVPRLVSPLRPLQANNLNVKGPVVAQALVLGGGIAGLSSAIGLAQSGWTVSIHEKAETIEPLGAALSLWPNASAALDRLGLLPSVIAAAAPMRSMLLADRHGKPIVGPRRIEGTALIITRAALQRCLTDALADVPLHLGQTVERVEVDTDRVMVSFTDGTSAAADLVIDAGGIRSVAAGLWGAAPTYAGYGGVVALSETVDGPNLDGLAAEYWGEHERFGVFELPERRRYWFYMRTQEEGQAAPTRDFIAVRAKGFPEAVRAAVAATRPHQLIPFAIHAKPAPKALGAGRIIGVGDAAHAMEPNLGQGACQALEDAAALSAVVRRAPSDQVLKEFEALRLKRVRFIVRRAAEGRYGAHGPQLGRTVMRALLRVTPGPITTRVMRATQTMPEYV